MKDVESAANTKNKKFTKKVTRLFIIIILFLTFFSKTINNFMLPEVEIITPAQGSLIRRINGKGTIKAKQSYEFYTKSSIKVMGTNVKPGQWVKKGQIIMSLDKKELEKELQDYLIVFKQKKIELQKLTNDDIEENYKMDIENAKEEVEQNQENLKTINTLYEAGIKTKEEVKKAETELKTSQRKYDNLLIKKEKALEEHELNVETTELDLQLQENKITELKEKLKAVDQIAAPTDGIIEELNFKKGSITNSSQPLFKMSDVTKGFELKVPVDNAKAFYLTVEDDVTVKITSLGGVRIEGKIRQINDSLQNEDVKNIFIDLDSKDLKGGEHAEIHIVKETENHKMLVPNEAICGDSEVKPHVLILKEKDGVLGKEYYAQKSMVYCDGSDNLNTSITEGISFFDKVIVKSNKPILPGCRVKLPNK